MICNADPKVALRLLGDAEIEPAYRERLEAWKVRSPVVKFNAALERLPTWTAAPGEDWPARATIDATGTMEEAQRAFEAARAASRRSRSARSTSRPATTRTRRRRASTC